MIFSGPVEVGELYRSKRSGRTVIPPLAWWASQRVFIDPFTHQLKIINGSVNGIVEYNHVVHFSSERDGTHTESVIFYFSSLFALLFLCVAAEMQ